MRNWLRSLDIWRCAIVKMPAKELCQSDLAADKLVWLPETNDDFTFRADPFGLWEAGKLHVFVERLDYRVQKGEIELLLFDRELNFLGSEGVLERPWHLSYPMVLRYKSEILEKAVRADRERVEIGPQGCLGRMKKAYASELSFHKFHRSAKTCDYRRRSC